MHFSSLVDRINGTGAAAWDIHRAALGMASEGEDVIVLSVGDPDFSTPDVIVQAACAALTQGDTHYAEVVGRLALRKAVSLHCSRGWGIPVLPEQVTACAGAQNGLFATALCLLQEGDEVLVPDPMYVTYESTLQASGAKLVRVPTRAQSGFRLEMAALRAAITVRTKALFIANPNNPTGVVLNREELLGIAELAKEHDLWVVMDEVYESLVFEGTHLSLASLEGMADRTITLGSLSKSHAMTGWRIGWIVAPVTLSEHLERLMLSMTYGLPGFSQQAAVVAFEHYEQVTTQMCGIYRRRRDLVIEALSACRTLRVQPPEAGMFVLVDVRATGLGSLDFAWRLLREKQVSVLDAAAFGEPAAGFVRLSFSLEDERLKEACRRIVLFVESLGVMESQNLPSIDVELPPSIAPAVREKRIELDRIHKRFGDNEVLKGISLTAREGDVISLIGSSGSGKSTLLRCINLLEVPDSGLVYVDGEGIELSKDRFGKPFVANQEQLTRIRTQLGMVFQNFNLWPHRTVLENLIEAPLLVKRESRAEVVERALALLDRVGMAHKRDEYPVYLSGGQQQRIAIARALAVQPRVMLFDEPTSALDPELVGEVLKLIRSLAEEGRTMILVTHEMAFARDVSSHVVFLHQGLIEEEGPPSQLFHRPVSERCRQFVNAQQNR